MVKRDDKMGRFHVAIEVANDTDLVLARRGSMPPDQVRKTVIQGLVDTGATRLVLPESTARQLGLEAPGTIKVQYADGRVAERSLAERVHVRLGERESIFNAVVEPDRDTALIGAIVLEDLDLVVDCTHQRLVPRDPNQIISEIE